MTYECPDCGARAVEGMEGNIYTSHMSGCSYRRTFGVQRRTLRDRGGELALDARRKFSEINWWVVLLAILLFLAFGAALDLFFDWLETYERGVR